MEILASNFATADDDLFLCAFVEYSTDIAVMITVFSAHMSVQVGQGAPVSFSTESGVKRGLHSE